jgi:hypothetical protein
MIKRTKNTRVNQEEMRILASYQKLYGSDLPPTEDHVKYWLPIVVAFTNQSSGLSTLVCHRNNPKLVYNIP